MAVQTFRHAAKLFPSGHRLPPDAVEAVLSIKADAPELSIREVIRRARKTGEVAAEVPLPPSTLHRLFTREGLMVREQQGPQKDMRRWAFPYAGDLWQSDSLHGPAVPDERGRLRKTYLLCTPRRRLPGRPPRRVPLHRKRVRVPAGVPRGVAAPGDPPALVRGPRRLLPFPATGRDLRQAGHRIDPRACIPCSRGRARSNGTFGPHGHSACRGWSLPQRAAWRR